MTNIEASAEDVERAEKEMRADFLPLSDAEWQKRLDDDVWLPTAIEGRAKCLALMREVERLKREAEKTRDAEAARWTKRLSFVHRDYAVDGSGVDSGDDLDVIESEIRMALEEGTRDEILEEAASRIEKLSQPGQGIIHKDKAAAAIRALKSPSSKGEGK